MPRAQKIFEFVFSLPSGLPGDHYTRCEMDYVAVAPGVADAALLDMRKAKEAAGLASFIKTFSLDSGSDGGSGGAGITSFAELHAWLFSNHDAYASNRLVPGHTSHAPIAPELLKTY